MDTKQILEAYIFQDIEKIMQKHGVDNKTLNAIKKDLWKPELLNELDSWSKRYLTEGHLWGDEPSACGKFLISELGPSSLVLDFGCGYGRDSKTLLEHGHRVEAIDKSKFAIIEAQEQLNEHIDQRNAHVTRGDIITAQITQKNFDAVLSHRTLHLPEPQDVPIIINRLAGVLKPAGLIVLTARSPKDFNPKQMDRINENTAVYKDRPTHRINFYDEDRFKTILHEQFTDLSFKEGEEIESIGNIDEEGTGVMSQFIQVIARKKTDQELEESTISL